MFFLPTMQKSTTKSVLHLFPIVILILTIVTSCEAGRILAVIPIPSYSHQIPYRPLWKTLSQRGHEVVVLTTDPINDPTLTNLTEINFKHNYERFGGFDFLQNTLDSLTWLDILRGHLWDVVHQLTHDILSHPRVKQMYAIDSGVEFDVVITEVFNPGCYVLAHRFDAPLIGIASLGLYSMNYYLLGAPVMPSHPSTWEIADGTGYNLPFFRRLVNYISTWWLIYDYLHDFIPKEQQIAESYLGPGLPSIMELEKNMSMVFMNQQAGISFPRPSLPNIFPFGNFHIQDKLAPLPKDLKAFVDTASEGFIYVSFGTNVRCSTFPEKVRQILVQVFSKLPFKVVWKCDAGIENKPDNVFVSNWFPQQSLLAHPKIRMYFYQGGPQSTEEAVHFAIPLLGMPIIADQHHQVNKMVELGVAKRIDLHSLTEESLEASILDITKDNRYKKNMLATRDHLLSKPHNSLDDAIWWTEFIMKHKGAPQFRNSIAHEPWLQKYDTDVIAFLSIIAFMVPSLFLMLIYRVINYVLRNDSKVIEKKKHHKKNE